MNDTELKELCIEVYKRTSWNQTKEAYYYYEFGGVKIEPYSSLVENDDYYMVAPLYTTDYLLPKLKSGAGVTKDSDGYTARRPSNLGVFPVGYKDPLHGRIGWTSDTPVKALLTMIIALDDAKELPHE